jgi:toxin ParE1/3/4
VNVRWSGPAEADLDAAVMFIAADDVAAALRMQDRLVAAVAALESFPRRGRPGRVEGTRELAVAGTPYLLIYEIAEDFISILRLHHGAQLWPPENAEC